MSDNDLIRRGDAMRIMSDGDDIVGPDYPEWFINRYAAINAIPAAQPTVSPDVVALVEALENVIGEYDLFRKYEYERGLAPLDDEIHEARAALARVKGVM